MRDGNIGCKTPDSALTEDSNKHPDHGLFEGTDPKKSLIIGLYLPILRVIPVFSRIQPGGNGK